MLGEPALFLGDVTVLVLPEEEALFFSGRNVQLLGSLDGPVALILAVADL